MIFLIIYVHIFFTPYVYIIMCNRFILHISTIILYMLSLFSTIHIQVHYFSSKYVIL